MLVIGLGLERDAAVGDVDAVQRDRLERVAGGSRSRG